MSERAGPPGETGASASAWPGADEGFGRHLGRIAEWLGIFGGALMLLVMLMTTISVAGRALFGRPIVGDYEITELACGIAIFLFLPYTQFTGGNIVAEFFTTRMLRRNQLRLDLIHNVVFAGFAAFLSWRIVIGGIEKYESLATSMMLRLPIWIAYLAGVAGLAGLLVVCVWIVVRLVAEERT